MFRFHLKSIRPCKGLRTENKEHGKKSDRNKPSRQKKTEIESLTEAQSISISLSSFDILRCYVVFSLSSVPFMHICIQRDVRIFIAFVLSIYLQLALPLLWPNQQNQQKPFESKEILLGCEIFFRQFYPCVWMYAVLYYRHRDSTTTTATTTSSQEIHNKFVATKQDSEFIQT